MDPYQPPTSELREHLAPRRYSHAVVAAVSAFIACITAGYVVELIGDPLYWWDVERDATLASVATACIFLSVKRLRWTVALLLGALVGCSLLLIANGVGILFDGYYYGAW